MLTSGLHAFVERPDNLGWRPAAMRAQGFSSVVVHALAHENDTDWFAAAVQLRDEARAAGMHVYCWQTLHPGFPAEACAQKAIANAPHWDGLVPNLEAALPLPEAAEYANLLVAGIPLGYPLGVSTLPQFELSAAARTLEAADAVLLQQAYVLENGYTPQACRTFVIDRPPVYVGWWYWTDFYALTPAPRIARCFVESDLGAGDYVLKDGANRWRVNEPTRNVYNRNTGKLVGIMRGLWRLPNVAPTVRTTPVNGQWLPAAELLDSFRAAKFIRGGLPDRGGLYLAESTQDPAAWTIT